MIATTLVLFALAAMALASSHSEAPGTAKSPRSDLSDLYFFRTPGSDDKVTVIANISPLAQSQAGPNYNPVDENFIYQLHFDNNGDAHEDVTFQFVFGALGPNLPISLIAYSSFDAARVPEQEYFLNVIENYRVRVLKGEDYVSVIPDPEDAPEQYLSTTQDRGVAPEGGDGKFYFAKAFENAGDRVFPGDSYTQYVEETAVYRDTVSMEGSSETASIFVGPRRDSFAVALGATFDLINLNPLTTVQDPSTNSLDRSGVITIAMDIPMSWVQSSDPVVGCWASVRELNHNSLDQHVAGVQVSRLANPLVNELIIGLPDKDRYSSSHPSEDAQFLSYFHAPAFPVIVESLFPVAKAPTHTRSDISTTLLRGLVFDDLNGDRFTLSRQTFDLDSKRKRNVGGPPGSPRVEFDIGHDDDDDDSSSSRTTKRRFEFDEFDTERDAESSESAPTQVRGNTDSQPISDILRLSFALPATPRNSQSSLGALGLDIGGYPNGRRLGDDVVDITLRVVMGVLCQPVPLDGLGGAFVGQTLDKAIGACSIDDAPVGAAPFTDGVPISACDFSDTFPYLNAPVPGNIAPQDVFPVQNGKTC